MRADGVRPELVIIAASAGGIVAISRVLSALPEDFPLPIAILQHRSAGAPSVLPRILARSTSLPVKEAEAGERFLPGIVYVAPPTAHLVVGADRRFGLQDGRKVNFLRSAADPLIH